MLRDESGKLSRVDRVSFVNIACRAEYTNIHPCILSYSLVRISGPFLVIKTVCSACAVREPSLVR